MPLGNKPFKNTVGKGEIARNEQFLLFPQCFSTRLDNFLPFSSNLKLSSANSFSLEESKICRLIMGSTCCNISINPFQNKPRYLRVSCTCLLKTLREKEELLVTSKFSFSHSVFYTFGRLSTIFLKFKILVCKLFQFGRV